MALAGVIVLFENKNLVFLGTSTEKGNDPLPFATGTYNFHRGGGRGGRIKKKSMKFHHGSIALIQKNCLLQSLLPLQVKLTMQLQNMSAKNPLQQALGGSKS